MQLELVMGSTQHKMMPKPGQSFGDMVAPPHQRMNIDTPLPGGIEERIRQLQKMRGPIAPPEQFQLLPIPRQVAPDNPPPPPPPQLKSVLIRDNMG